MRIRLLAALVVYMALISTASAAQPTVVFLLDCSREMGQKLRPAPAQQQQQVGHSAATTCFDAAYDAMATALDQLSVAGTHRVGIWLIGHRLAWEADKQEPDLLEQTAYLEQTLGFNVLAELLPGDDVELVRPLITLEPNDLAQLAPRLKLLKPWGEDPLYLGLVRVLDSFERVSDAERRVIVITTGKNSQGLSRYQTDKQKVLEAAGRRPVPVHIVRIEGTTTLSRQAESELRQIGEATHGSYATASTTEELVKRIQGALADEPVDVPPTPVAGEPSTQPRAVSNVRAADPQPRTIEGTVIFYKQPVNNATVKLKGGAAPRQVRTDAAGKFKFEKVPAGTYTLECEAIVKNRIRTGSAEVTVEGNQSGPITAQVTVE